MKAKQHYITKGIVAMALDINTRQVGRYETLDFDPLPVAIRGGKGKPHQYDITAVVAWWLRFRVSEMTNNPAGEFHDYDKERARLVYEQADKVELENAQTRGDLIPAPVVKAVWTKVIMNMRAVILALPTRIAHQLQAAESLDEYREIVKDGCYAALTEIANNEFESTSRISIDKLVRELQPCDGKQATPPDPDSAPHSGSS
jgi:phage terminase Nu1 subunit (DNA packaging protein)